MGYGGVWRGESAHEPIAVAVAMPVSVAAAVAVAVAVAEAVPVAVGMAGAVEVAVGVVEGVRLERVRNGRIRN